MQKPANGHCGAGHTKKVDSKLCISEGRGDVLCFINSKKHISPDFNISEIGMAVTVICEQRSTDSE